jgi:hypothetical protein
MARGKHAEKSVRESINNLKIEVENGRKQLAIKSKELAKASKELDRFRALENVFSENSDALRQLNDARIAVEILSTENALYREKLAHYIEVMSSDDNLKFSQEILGDMADFGLLAQTFNNNREHKRYAKNRNSLTKTQNRIKQINEFKKSRGALVNKGVE